MRHSVLKTCFAALLAGAWAVAVVAQNAPCRVDLETLRFAGSPVAQAMCLLRPNRIGGALGSELKSLPKPLEKLIGQPVNISRVSLRRFLAKDRIDEAALGGPIDKPLATAALPDGSTTQAEYFIIHDTSSPYLKDEPYPPKFDTDASWHGNDLSIWTGQPVAHVFVNRLGESLTTTPFAEPVRKGFGTKFARDVLKQDAKGLQLHIELSQPRRRDPGDSNPGNDRFAPSPGFTNAQYARLALLYVCASVRRGTWLIPAYHSAVDAGIKDAHDDPQNFVLSDFANELEKLVKKLKKR